MKLFYTLSATIKASEESVLLDMDGMVATVVSNISQIAKEFCSKNLHLPWLMR
jgi:hypothetical protein